jgi:hypothetical protein
MSGNIPFAVASAREIERTVVQTDARLCSRKFGRVCKALWPIKTSEELASRVGCAVRTAAYEIAGEREPSARSVAAIITEILERD